jgi:hypothetical protein
MRTKIKKTYELGSKGWLPSIPSRVYMEAPKRLNQPYLITRDASPSRANLEVFRFSPSDGCPVTASCLASTQVLRSRRVSFASKLLGASDQGGQIAPLGGYTGPGDLTDPSGLSPFWAVEPAWVAAPPRRVFGLGFLAQPSNLVVFW